MLLLLAQLYAPLLGWTTLGILLQRVVPSAVLDRVGSRQIGAFLFWIGVPLGVMGFLQQTSLSEGVWLAPLVAYGALGLGWGLALLWMRHSRSQGWTLPQQGSFQLIAMLGNTGYIGYPICLLVGGADYFGWALFYDLLGTFIGSYGLGAWVAHRYRSDPLTGFSQTPPRFSGVDLGRQILQSPALWGLGLGLVAKSLTLPSWFIHALVQFAWATIPLALLLLGMRLGEMPSWRPLPRTWVCLGIRLVLVPLGIGLALLWMPLDPVARLILVLQAGMPPAMATLVLSETYGLDRGLTVTALAIGSLAILVTLPLWLLLWGQGITLHTAG